MQFTQVVAPTTPTINRTSINRDSIRNDIFEIISNDQDVKEQIQSLRENSKPEDIVNILQDVVIKRIEQRLIALEQKTNSIEQQLENIQFNANSRERISRQKNLRFIGMKEQADIVKSITEGAAKIGIQLKDEDIEYCHPLGQKKKEQQSPQPVIAAFLSRFKLKSLLLKRKEFRQATGISIFEDVTRYDKWLLDQMRDSLEDEDRKYVFTRGGRVCYKTEDQGIVFISSYDDIQRYLYG
ncbi:unnamed protein product [Didymodactylos carnosus]|uniref:Uncharacterized protein n=1 Tax=Didymodactylos carnosus TaxID=1234261 RepID=A0A814Z186_9BILA|nr:unnamed protein product [Didymodactylos carnosus]CAF3998234.1 unnamed protein product [Didymodactylos carnosus]